MALKDKLMTLEDFKAVRDVDVASNSAQFTEIKADLDAASVESDNLLDVSRWLANTTGFTINGTEISAKNSDWNSIPALPITFKSSTQYTFDFSYKYSENASSLRGTVLTVTYSDSKVTELALMLTQQSYTGGHVSITTTAEKTISSISFSYKNGANAILYIKDFMIVEGTEAPETYLPPKTIADKDARSKVNALIPRVEALEEFDYEGIEESLETLRDAFGMQRIDVTLTGENGYYWNSQNDTAVKTAYSTYYAYNPVSVTPGRTYYAHIRVGGSNKQNPILFVDANNLILERVPRTVAQDQFDDFVVTAPEGSVYMLITTTPGGVPYTELYYRQLTDIELAFDTVNRQINRIGAAGFSSMDFSGKTIAVIGDSISTNGSTGDKPNAVEITIEEEDVGVSLSAYLTKQDVDAELSIGGITFTSEQIGTEVTFVPVSEDIGKKIGLPINYNNASRVTWWEHIEQKLNCNVIPVCWSGASITSHEASSAGYEVSYAWHVSQIRKCGIRTPGSMTRTAPDVIIVYRGVNDFSHAPAAKLTSGYFDNLSWLYPESDVVEGGYGFKEGYSLLIKKLREAYPSSVIVLCTLTPFKRNVYQNFPTRNGNNLLPQYNAAIREIADFFGCGVISFDKCGITYENCYSEGYITDSSTQPTHPNDKGHSVMGKRAIIDLMYAVNGMS